MKLVLLIASTLIFTGSFAQSGNLEFKDKAISLENLKVDDQPTEVIFKYKNTGTQPVIISRVVPVSSELHATWDNRPVMPEKSSEIKISFIPANMPERFSYNITVFSNASRNREQLQLSASIIDNPKKPELLYKYDIGGLKFKTGNVYLDKIYSNQIITDTLYFYNGRQEAVKVGKRYAPAYIDMTVYPAEVAAGKKGMLIFTYDAVKKNDYGYAYDNLILSLNDDQSYNNRLAITANIVEDFSRLSKNELQNAPVASFDKQSIDFGNIKPGEKANCDFILENKGKSNLIIRKTKASCGCTAVALGESTVAPGKSTTIRATFDSAGKQGRQYKSITVITNDPQKPEVSLTISGNIGEN